MFLSVWFRLSADNRIRIVLWTKEIAMFTKRIIPCLDVKNGRVVKRSRL